ncbi:hypothetical protein L9F63_015896 [Diploptera punctata]|uniref:Uncharacterized protein n=1 Tax=Diploptera punctata TaxID=6984 RepID=A0AAD8EJ38_DIPPU|nr:hypothetical protein L9F63_015896 [Diploptera punctata]
MAESVTPVQKHMHRKPLQSGQKDRQIETISPFVEWSQLDSMVAARKDDDDDELIPNGGMVLDLTAELGGLVRGAPPLSEVNNASIESQQTTSTTSRQVGTPEAPKHKPDT